MATLHLICGLPGAGKTTLAKKLETELPALRLTPDEWIAQILTDVSDRAELDRLRDPIEAIQWEVAAKTLALGVDVILDFGFWGREERKEFRHRAEALGAVVKWHFLVVEREELWTRIAKRNAELPPGTFYNSEEEFDKWWSVFEPPTPDELESNDPIAQ